MSDKKTAITIGTQSLIDGASAFLSRICLPASEEFGLLLKDKVSSWRANNTLNTMIKFEKKLNQMENSKDFHAHPRLVTMAIEAGSFTDNEDIQDMWAGLLATACDSEGRDENNLIFMNILSQINSTEAILLKYICDISRKTVTSGGLIWGEDLNMTPQEITNITGITNIHRMDRELDHLIALDLISGGFNIDNLTTFKTAPRALGLHMYISCQGSRLSPPEYFSVNYEDNPYKSSYALSSNNEEQIKI